MVNPTSPKGSFCLQQERLNEMGNPSLAGTTYRLHRPAEMLAIALKEGQRHDNIGSS